MLKNMTSAKKHSWHRSFPELSVFNGTGYYRKFLKAFYSPTKKNKFDLRDGKISKAIYYHLFMLRAAEWDMKVNFFRKKSHDSSSYFQDLMAFYLKQALGKSYAVVLEEKKGKVQPDILVRYKDKNIFILEIKTTIGWNRSGPEIEFPKRIKTISKTFHVPYNNILFIFEGSDNVDKKFKDMYWDNKKNCPNKQTKAFPYSAILPLFKESANPYYLSPRYSKIDREVETLKFSMADILDMADSNIIFKVEDIITRIRKAK